MFSYYYVSQTIKCWSCNFPFPVKKFTLSSVDSIEIAVHIGCILAKQKISNQKFIPCLICQNIRYKLPLKNADKIRNH